VLSQAAAEAKHQNKPAEAAEVVKPQLVPLVNTDKDVGDVHTYSDLDMHLSSLHASGCVTFTSAVQGQKCGYVRLPACLNPKQRAVLHALAEQHGLAHTSLGEGQARQLLLGNSQEPLQVAATLASIFPPPKEVNQTCTHGLSEVQDVENAAEELSNELLCELLDNHLHIDARPSFAAAVALSPIHRKQAAHPHKVMLLWQDACSLYVGTNGDAWVVLVPASHAVINEHDACWLYSHPAVHLPANSLLLTGHGCWQGSSTGDKHAYSDISVSDFISSTLPLLEMEKNAEVAQVSLMLLAL